MFSRNFPIWLPSISFLLLLLLLIALCQMPPTILAASSPNPSMSLPTKSPISEARGAPKMQEELLPGLDCLSFFSRILGCGKTCRLGNCVSTNENKCNCAEICVLPFTSVNLAAVYLLFSLKICGGYGYWVHIWMRDI